MVSRPVLAATGVFSLVTAVNQCSGRKSMYTPLFHIGKSQSTSCTHCSDLDHLSARICTIEDARQPIPTRCLTIYQINDRKYLIVFCTLSYNIALYGAFYMARLYWGQYRKWCIFSHCVHFWPFGSSTDLLNNLISLVK